MKKTYHGSCHCGRVRFEADLDLEAGTGRCNCSYCSKLRAWNATYQAAVLPFAPRVVTASASTSSAPSRAIIASATPAASPQFGDGDVKEIGGAFVSVNVACLDDITPEELAKLPIQYMDGRHDNSFQPPKVTQLPLSPEGKSVPPHGGTAQEGRAFAFVDGREAVAPSQFASFPGRDVEHATAGRRRAMAQRQRHQAARTDQRRDADHRALALGGIEMHPDRGQHDDVVALAPFVHAVEIGQRIVDPGDWPAGMQALSFGPEFCRRFDAVTL